MTSKRRTAADATASRPQLMSVTEAGRRLSVGKTKAYELVADGLLRVTVVGSVQKVSESEIERFIAANTH